MFTLLRQSRATTSVLAILDFVENKEPEPNLGRWRRLSRRFRLSSSSTDRDSFTNEFGLLKDRFLMIAIKIAMYPITLIIINVIITRELSDLGMVRHDAQSLMRKSVGDLYLTDQGIGASNASYALFAIYLVFYGARGIPLALVCTSALDATMCSLWRIARLVFRSLSSKRESEKTAHSV